MSEWSTTFPVVLGAVTKTYRVAGESLDRLDVWRVGSTGFPVHVGVLHGAAEGQTPRWELREHWPIDAAEQEVVRFEAVRAWRAHLGHIDDTGDQTPSREGSGPAERNQS